MQKVAFLHFSKTDPHLFSRIESVELPVIEPQGEIFRPLLRSIAGQQLSIKAAETIYGRFEELFENKIPTAKALSEMPVEPLRACGLSFQKASYMKNIADFDLIHQLDTVAWHEQSDEEIIDFLCQIKGVGQWTVQMVLMFTLCRPDVLPTADLGIQLGIKEMYGLESSGKSLLRDMERLAEPWRPFRSVACRAIWKVR